MKVTGLLFGGNPQEHEFADGDASVSQLRQRMNIPTSYLVTVNGEPADEGTALQNGSFVAFTPAIKGGKLWLMLPNGRKLCVGYR